MYDLRNRAEVKCLCNRKSITTKHWHPTTKTISLMSVAFIFLFTDMVATSAETRAECNAKAQASSGLMDKSDLKTCNTQSGFGFFKKKTIGVAGVNPTNQVSPNAAVSAASPPIPTPGSHVAVSGSIALDSTISLPGGTKMNTGASLSVNDSVKSAVSTSPSISSGMAGGNGMAGASSIGNGSAQANGNGSGDSFVESALSDATATSDASGLGAALGLGGGVGLSGSVD